MCDGVNLYIPGGSYIGYPAFIRHLYYLAKRDNSRRYIITATPSCSYPDSVLGPAPNKAFDIAVKYINHVSMLLWRAFEYYFIHDMTFAMAPIKHFCYA